MKLKLKRPNLSPILFAFLICCCYQNQTPFTEATSNQEAPLAPSGGGGQLCDARVSDLQLKPELRAARLLWRYKKPTSKVDEPDSFAIRFCELTSWNIEIKCNGKKLRVAQVNSTSMELPLFSANQIKETPVISASTVDAAESTPFGTIRRLDDQLDDEENKVYLRYETTIFDLRALTNYTFNVVRSDAHCSASAEQIWANSKRDQMSRSQAARRLDGFEQSTHELNGLKLETKPFKAEVTKCLANSSEVVVNTGRFFGGRISVDGKLDPKCTMVGNRTSEQSSYSFRIDHKACGSRTIDGNRIESMILVHENKDILTHSTARFFVLCNFNYKPFTVRASISLPKVNALLEPVAGGQITRVESPRPAMITFLPGRPNVSAPIHDAPVMLGSMPGYFHQKHRSESSEENAISSSNSEDLKPTNRHESAGEPPLQQVEPKSRRQHKRLYAEVDSSTSKAPVAGSTTTSSDLDNAASGQLFPPQATVATRSMRQLLAANDDTSREESQTAPIVLTNNHRVAGSLPPSARPQLNQSNATSESPDFSIKYSAAKVDEFAVDAEDAASARRAASSRTIKPRAGRMRSIQEADGAGINRMGDSIEARDESSSAELPMQAEHLAPNSTLAQNITSALLRWSIKTIANIAKKSLETFAAGINETRRDEFNDSFSGATLNSEQSSPDTSSATFVHRPVVETATKQPEPVPTFHTQARQSADVSNRPRAKHVTSEILEVKPAKQGAPMDKTQMAKMTNSSSPIGANSGERRLKIGWWLPYSAALLIVMSVGLILMLWLIYKPIKQDLIPSQAINPALFQAAPNLGGGGGPPSICSNHPNDIFFDQNRNITNLLVGTHQPTGLISSYGPSCSAASSPRADTASNLCLVTDENDCRNSEIHFTDHILLDSGRSGSSHRGESFA